MVCRVCALLLFIFEPSIHIFVLHTHGRCDMHVILYNVGWNVCGNQCHYPCHPLAHTHQVRTTCEGWRLVCAECDVCFRIARHRSFGTRVISVSLWTPNTILHSALCHIRVCNMEWIKSFEDSLYGRRRWICVCMRHRLNAERLNLKYSHIARARV